MKRCAVLLILLAGCVARPGTQKPVEPADKNPVRQAAGDAIDNYRAALAAAADGIAERTDTFKSWEEFYQAWSKRNEEVNTTQFAAWTDRLNEEFGFEKQADGTVKVTKPYDSAKAAQVAKDSGRGFRGK